MWKYGWVKSNLYICTVFDIAFDSLDRSIRMLCNPGDYVITEEWSYPSAFACIRPNGAKIVGVKVDAQGMSAIDLAYILNTWDEKVRGAKRCVLFFFAYMIFDNATSI